MSANSIDITTATEQEIKLVGFDLFHKKELAAFQIKQIDEQLNMITTELARRAANVPTETISKQEFLDKKRP